MLKHIIQAASAIAFCVTAGMASAASVATIDSDGFFGISTAEDAEGLIVAGSVVGVNNGISLDNLLDYQYSAALWVCEEDTDFEDECDRSDDPLIEGSVSGGDVLSFLLDSPDGIESYGEIIIGVIEDLFGNGGVAEIYDTGIFLGVAIEDFFVDEDGFEAFLVAYLGVNEDCAEGVAEQSGEFCDEDDFDIFGSYSLALSIDEVPPVPLPAGLPLMIAGLGVIGFVGRRRKSKAD